MLRPANAAGVRIRLLGRFEVERGGTCVDASAFRRRRPLDLLILLALTPQHTLRRDQAVRRLWPGLPPSAGTNNLHRALFDLRRILGDDVAALDKGVLRLHADARVDAAELVTLVTKGDPASLEAALELYRGDLCPEAESSEERAALRARFVAAGLLLAKSLSDRAAVGRAIEVLRQVLAIAGASEEAHRLLIRLLAESGRRAEAEAQLEACVQAMSRQGRQPSAGTLEALESAVSGRPRRPGPADLAHVTRRLLGAGEPARLRGREETLRRLTSVTAPGAVLLSGEAGIGKTRLALEAARRAFERGAALVSAIGLEFAGAMPYQPFVSAFNDFLRSRGLPLTDSPFEGFAPSPEGAPQEDTLRLITSVERTLLRLSAEGPVCLVLDDLHLFDESSLHLVHFLARSARTEPLLLVLTCREEGVTAGAPVAGLLAALHRERLCERIPVSRLDRAATAEQIADLLGHAVPSSAVDAIHGLSDGIPYFTEEIVLSEPLNLTERAPRVPQDVASALMERVGRLPEDATSLLRAASVLGVAFELEVCETAAGLPRERALAAVERCLALRLLEEDPSGYRFRHTLAREALYGSLTAARRADLHRRVARALEAGSPAQVLDRAETLAFHLRAAGEHGRAIPHLLAAGQRAAARAGLKEAVAFLEEARALMATAGVPPGPEMFELLVALGKLRLALSDLDGSRRDLDAAAALTRPEDGWRPVPGRLAEARRWCALCLITAGDLPAAAARLETALTELDEAPDDPEWSSLLYHVAQLRWHEGRHREAYETAERCLTLAERRGERAAIAQGYEMLALACHSLGEWRNGAAFEERRESLAGGAVDVAQAFDAHL